MSHQQDRGRIVNVEPSNSFQGFESTKTEEECQKDVLIQCKSVPPAGCGLTFEVEFWKGEARFVLGPFLLTTSNLKQFFLSARQVQFNFNMPLVNPSTGGANPPIQVSVSIADGAGAYKGPQGGFGQWLQSPIPPAAMSDVGQMIPTGVNFKGGSVYEGQVNLAVMPPGAAAVWLLLFDQAGAAAPAPGDTPVPGGRSSVMTGVSSTPLFSNATPLEFSNGIKYALSLSPASYVAPAAGGQVTVDVNQGG